MTMTLVRGHVAVCDELEVQQVQGTRAKVDALSTCNRPQYYPLVLAWFLSFKLAIQYGV